MESAVIALTFAAAAFILVLLVRILTAQSRSQGNMDMLASQLEALRSAQENLSGRLQETLGKGQAAAAENLKFNSQTLEKVNNQLGRLQEASKKVTELGSDLKNLQQILASPKLRGGLGEWALENILAAVLPRENYQLQHSFKDGKKVDCIVRMPEYCVPIDAKFPLENFKKLQQRQTAADEKTFRRQFLKDVRNHIDKIAANYIKPDEGTLDFAIMFIPAENVYYETTINLPDESLNIVEYAMAKKVFAVSPNLLYVYLMTIVMGLHGLQIEKQAALIRQNLKALNVSFAEFISNWDTLGSHIRNAGGKYDDGQKKLDKLVIRLEQIQKQDGDA